MRKKVHSFKNEINRRKKMEENFLKFSVQSKTGMRVKKNVIAARIEVTANLCLV